MVIYICDICGKEVKTVNALKYPVRIWNKGLYNNTELENFDVCQNCMLKVEAASIEAKIKIVTSGYRWQSEINKMQPEINSAGADE